MSFRRSPPSVRIDESALDEGLAIAQQRLPLETGGILLGWRDVGCIHVAQFIEVWDPNAQHVTYERNHAAAQAALRAAKAELPLDSLLGYVGEWHTHPTLQPPSRQDRKELKAIGRMGAQPLAMIVLSSSGERWQPFAVAAAGRTVRAAVSTDEEK
jgi:proteasome lid subunit RPN8/RPN11